MVTNIWRYSSELYHYGVKGMKWGVRRTAEELRIARRTIISGHSPTPKESSPNSVMDHIGRDGKIDTRTFYGKTGLKEKDIHTTNHGHPKQHNYGKHGEHVVLYEWNTDGSLKTKIKQELSEKERKENGDIL